MFVSQTFNTRLQDDWILQASHLLSSSSEEEFSLLEAFLPLTHYFPLSTSLGLHSIKYLLFQLFFNSFLLY